MRQALRIILAMALGFGMTIAAVEVSDQVSAATPGARLGRLDFYRYCDQVWGSESGPLNSTLAPNGWTCVVGRGPTPVVHKVDVDLACEELYGAPAYADLNSTSAFDWACFRGPRTLR